MRSINLFVSAGEVSGDKHAAEVIQSLKQQISSDVKTNIWGMGGQNLKKENVELIQDSTNLGVMGGADVIKKLPFFMNLKKRLIESIRRRKPDIALLVDYPGLNLRLAAAIKKHVPSCKIICYVAPQVWAWNYKRIYKLPSLVDRLFPILPFEENLHQEHGTCAKYVGNPTAWSIDQMNPDFDSVEFKKSIGFNPDQPLIGIYPGSREREIDYMLPVFLEAAKNLKELKPETQFVLVRSNSIKEEKLNKYFKKHSISKDSLIKVESYEKNLSVLRSIDVAWLKSGTVTLEAACCETPLIIGYKEFPLFWKVFLYLRQIDRIGLPNIIGGGFVCPELLQNDCKAENWVSITERWLKNPEELQSMKNNLRQLVKLPLQPQMNPAVYIAREILMIYQIDMTSKNNVFHMKEQAHKNSQQTKQEISLNESLNRKKN
ncbi:MAG: lipid-A-disaccharide synthase [Candidatus Caenarcaniphilales bacterium]|nr:lipid-A-disaccharide synthase [Candidatus Caenarcaniphilales bacterium]